MQRGTRDDADPESVKKCNAIDVEGQSLSGEKGQVCAGETRDQSYPRQQVGLPSSNKQQDRRFINDRKQLLRLLPEESWLDVFDKLVSSDDLEAVSNSSPFFRELLLPERVNFLFKNVWKIVGRKYVNSPHTDLALLSVCRSWNKDIEKLNEFQTLCFENCGLKKAISLRSHFDATHRLPGTRGRFFAKSIMISIDGDNDDLFEALDGFENGLTRFLDKYGKRFWHCKFSEFDTYNNFSSDPFSSRIRAFIQRMPNLKTLQINGMKVSKVDYHRTTSIVNPFSALNGLVELTLDAGSLLLPIFQQLISINGHASTSSQSPAAAELNRPLVSGLKTLSVDSCPQDGFEMITSDQFDWHLSKLQLDLQKCGFIHWQTVFTALENKFGHSLTELRLNLPKITSEPEWERISDESTSYKLHLPHLTQLELVVGNGNSPCLDFLLPMKNSLQVLILSIWELDDEKAWMKQVEGMDTGVLKIWSCLKCPLQSNIWTEFPKLEKFDFVFRDKRDEHRGLDHLDFYFKSFAQTRREWRKEMQNSKGSTLAN